MLEDFVFEHRDRLLVPAARQVGDLAAQANRVSQLVGDRSVV
jgi:hypothetical protein